MSPYNAFDNNPVFWADPSGADSIFDGPAEAGAGVDFWYLGDDIAAYSREKFGVVGGDNGSGSTTGKISASWTQEDEAQFPGDDAIPGAKELPAVIANSKESLYAGLEQRANGALTIWSNYGQHSSGFLTDVWNDTFTRLIIKDTYSIGLSSNVCAFLGTGTTPINFTLVTRGKAPGIYFTPTVNGAVGTEVSANAGIAFSSGNYTGNPGQITPSMLQGTSYGASAEIGDVVSVSAGASYAPVNKVNPFSEGGFINSNVQIGVGFGAGAQINIQETTKVEPLIQF